MEIVFTVLILLTTVAFSGLGLSLLPVKLPLPLVQIAIGTCLAWPGFGLHVTFDPELFMLLFIPPLLFADGWRIPKRELYMQRRAILMLALGLVFITVGLLGYFLHAMIPSMLLPVACIPANLMHILEGEALMNDASGLVALKFAIAAALTGMFLLRDATVSFFIIAAGVLAIGATISWGRHRNSAAASEVRRGRRSDGGRHPDDPHSVRGLCGGRARRLLGHSGGGIGGTSRV